MANSSPTWSVVSVGEFLRADTVELKINFRRAHLIAAGVGAFDVFAGQAVGQFLLHQERLQHGGAVRILPFHGQHRVTRLDNALFDQSVAVRMDHAEFEESGLLDVLAGFVLRRLRKTRQLNHDVVEANRLDDRLGHAEIIHPMPQHFGRLRNQAQPLVGPHGGLDCRWYPH